LSWKGVGFEQSFTDSDELVERELHLKIDQVLRHWFPFGEVNLPTQATFKTLIFFLRMFNEAIKKPEIVTGAIFFFC